LSYQYTGDGISRSSTREVGVPPTTSCLDFYEEVLRREQAAPEVAKEAKGAKKAFVMYANYKVKDAAKNAYNWIEWVRYIPIRFRIKRLQNNTEEYGPGKAKIYYPVQVSCWVVTFGMLLAIFFPNDPQYVGIEALFGGEVVGLLLLYYHLRAIIEEDERKGKERIKEEERQERKMKESGTVISV
jgi:hypothetical protein